MQNQLVFRQLFDGKSSTYTYLIGDRANRDAIIIDSVFEQHLRDSALIAELGLRLRVALDTHCHADHVTGAWLLREATGCQIGISDHWRGQFEGPDLWIAHGQTIHFGNLHLEARATPGHTSGCMTFVMCDRGMAFTGDCLLIRGAGRCDFQEGDAHLLYRSITEQIFTLPDECLIFPGHDYTGRTVSSVAEERAHNPRIGGGADERDFVGFMQNLKLPHPKQIDIAVPANMRSGRPEDDAVPRPAEWGPVRQSYAGLLEVEPGWVGAHRDQVLVLDVRQREEWNDALGHIEGAVCIPLGQLQARMEELPRDRPVITVCHAGARSAQATVLLRSAGFERVANLHGGMLLWRELGLPVVHS